MTCMFLLALAFMGFVMKLLALLVPPHEKVRHPMLFWLLLCPATHRRPRNMSVLPFVLKRYALIVTTSVICLFGYDLLWGNSGNSLYFRNYLAAPILFLLSEAFVGLVTLAWLPSGKVLPVIHNVLWRMQSVADFWGRRWNLWFSDWASAFSD